MKRIYKSYHPRVNQLWCEVDAEYLGRLDGLRCELERQGVVTHRKREYNHRWYLAHKLLVAQGTGKE